MSDLCLPWVCLHLVAFLLKEAEHRMQGVRLCRFVRASPSGLGMTMGSFTLWAAAPITGSPRTCPFTQASRSVFTPTSMLPLPLGLQLCGAPAQELCHAPGQQRSFLPWELLGDGYFSIASPGADWYHSGLRFVCDSWSSDGGGTEQALPCYGLEGLWTNLSFTALNFSCYTNKSHLYHPVVIC